MTQSRLLLPSDSPLILMVLGQYVSSLMQETIMYLELPYDKLAHEMSIPKLILRDAVEGKMGLTRGQWVKFGKRCWVCQQPISYDPASVMSDLAGKSAFRPFPLSRTNRYISDSTLVGTH